MERFMAQKGLCNLAKEKIMRERGELPKEEGDAVREYKAMHEENFLSSWPREDEKSKEERRAETEGEGEKREKRGKERESQKDETLFIFCGGL